jgi:NarL family two-component system response regulator LiaR
LAENIHVLIVDDHDIVREGQRALINTEPGMEVIGEAKNGIEAIELADKLQPDVILMDLLMPKKDGIKASEEIKKRNPEARILVLTSFAEDERVFEAIKAGAQGYLLKDSTPQNILNAIHEVHNGETSLSPRIAQKLIHEIQRKSDSPPTEEPLTAREMEVLKLIAKGLSNQQIAEELVISEPTARTHVTNILGKLHLANRTQAALYALREGLADL